MDAPGFELAAPLVADCHRLGRLPFTHVLLMNKAEVPWFILVPETTAVEVCDLAETDQARLLDETNRVARFVRAHYSLYSSANNHLIGEATGVFVAALTWPYWEEAAAWRGEALAIL